MSASTRLGVGRRIKGCYDRSLLNEDIALVEYSQFPVERFVPFRCEYMEDTERLSQSASVLEEKARGWHRRSYSCDRGENLLKLRACRPRRCSAASCTNRFWRISKESCRLRLPKPYCVHAWARLWFLDAYRLVRVSTTHRDLKSK